MILQFTSQSTLQCRPFKKKQKTDLFCDERKPPLVLNVPSVQFLHRLSPWPASLFLLQQSVTRSGALFTHVENTIAHQRFPGERHKWAATWKQGQNKRLDWTVTPRTMPANYSSCWVCLSVISLSGIAQISCRKCWLSHVIIHLISASTMCIRHDTQTVSDILNSFGNWTAAMWSVISSASTHVS